MKIPATVIAFGIIAIGQYVFGLLRAKYLCRHSENISINPAEKIVLRYAIWYYIYPLLGFGLTAVFFEAAFAEANAFRFRGYLAVGTLCLLCGVFLLVRQLAGRVKIYGGKLEYTEGSIHFELMENEIIGFTLNGLIFSVRRSSGDTVRIPALFNNAEKIAAFLRRASFRK